MHDCLSLRLPTMDVTKHQEYSGFRKFSRLQDKNLNGSKELTNWYRVVGILEQCHTVPMVIALW